MSQFERMIYGDLENRNEGAIHNDTLFNATIEQNKISPHSLLPELSRVSASRVEYLESELELE